jgi:hypothetical protein
METNIGNATTCTAGNLRLSDKNVRHFRSALHTKGSEQMEHVAMILGVVRARLTITATTVTTT